jgi:hypothetical protein
MSGRDTCNRFLRLVSRRVSTELQGAPPVSRFPMSGESMRKAVAVFVWCVGIFCILLLVGTTACAYWSNRTKRKSTQHLLMIFERKAAEFRALNARWPADLAELTTYIGVPALSNDSWGGVFLYSAPRGQTIGTICSYGKDRLPGGTGADEDHCITFGK